MKHAKTRRISRNGSHQPLRMPAISHVLAIMTLASETRHALRLFGLVRLFSAGLGLSPAASDDCWSFALAILQRAFLGLYQVTENVAFMVAKGVISKSWVERLARLESWYLWSARFLLGGVIAQLVRLWRESIFKRTKNRDSDLKEIKSTQGSQSLYPGDDRHKFERRLKSRAWWQSLTTSILWTPLCLHWSLTRGMGIPNPLVGLLSLSASAWGMHESWKKTSPS